MARNAALPMLTAEPGHTHYLEEIRRFPMLERQEEYLLAKRWREHGDRDAARKRFLTFVRQSQTDASPICLGSLSDQVPTCLKRLNGL